MRKSVDGDAQPREWHSFLSSRKDIEVVPVSPPPGPLSPRPPLLLPLASCPKMTLSRLSFVAARSWPDFPIPTAPSCFSPFHHFPPTRAGQTLLLRDASILAVLRRPPHLHVIRGPRTRHPPEHSLRCLTALVETSSRHVPHHVSSSSSSPWQGALFCCRRCFLQTSLPAGPRRCCCLNQSAPVDKTNQPRARSKDGS